MIIEAPFEIRQYNYTLKPETRSIPALGSAIAGITHGTESLGPVTDGSGLEDVDNDRLAEHSTDESRMWSGGTDALDEGLVFEFPEKQMLENILVWNYNKPAYTDRGIQTADISVWTEEAGWKTVLKGAVLQEAEGTDDYDEPTLLTIEPVTAQKVRFANMTAFDAEAGQIGLSEIRFFQPLGPTACNPEPADGGEIGCSQGVALLWTAGRHAVAHDIYIGENGEPLTLLGRVKGDPRVTVGGLTAGTDYTWRVDEVDKDGSVAAGSIWKMHVRGRQAAHWTLDATADDALGQFPGRLAGQASWQDGHSGQAIYLDGQADYIEVPPLNLNTDTVTLCAWINAQAQQAATPGVIFCRSDQTVAGIHLFDDTLHYHWNDQSQSYNWNSGLTVPLGRWVFAALTVQPEKAMLYLYDPQSDQWQSAENAIPHLPEEFDGPLCIGRDSGFGDRYYKGMIDEVHVFDYPLSRNQLEQVCRGQLPTQEEAVVRLLNANLVAPDESLAAIAAEQAGPQAAGKRKNLIAVGLIMLAVVGFAGLTVFRNKKAA